MDPGIRTPIVDAFRRGEVARDIRLLAARGAFAPAALDQVALLLVLLDDGDAEIAAAARSTVEQLPSGPLETFLKSPDVSKEIAAFFAGRGAPPPEPVASERPLDGAAAAAQEDLDPAIVNDANEGTLSKRITTMGVMEKVKLAMRGTREARGLLIRDPNRLVSSAVLSSPKLTEAEVEAFAKMGNVGEEVLRLIGTNRNWTKNYGVIAGLCRNAKTPVAISMHLLQRINDKDVKMLATDRNIPEPLRVAARKRAAATRLG